MSDMASGTHRRGFLGGVAAGAAALVASRWSTAGAEIFEARESSALDDSWVAKIHGKYRQVFDATAPNDGWGAAFPLNFSDSTKEALKVTDADITGITVFRHFAMPLMLNDATWAKYKIGAMLKVNDPKTNAPAVKNIFRDNVPLRPGLTYEQEMAKGVIFVACNLALTVISGMAAPGAGVTADQAKKDFTAGLIPGVYLAASGVYAVNRAQQAGCTYCFGG